MHAWIQQEHYLGVIQRVKKILETRMEEKIIALIGIGLVFAFRYRISYTR